MTHDEFEYNFAEDSSWDEGVVVDEPEYSIFEESPIPYQERIPNPTSPLNDGVNLGNRIELHGDINNLPYPVSAAEWLVNDSHKVVGMQRLLTVRPQDLMSQAPGSWVVTLKGKILDSRSVTISNPDMSVPLVARVSYGAGGVTQYFDVDAWRSMFSVPSNDFIVDVGWRQPGTAYDEAAGVKVPTFVPILTEVSATAHRSLETGESVPTCSFFLCRGTTDAAGIIKQEIDIPPQAVSWCISTGLIVPLGSAILGGAGIRADTARSLGNNPAIVDRLDDAQLVSMIRGRCFRELPAYAATLNVSLNLNSLGGFPITNYVLLTFRLGV